MLRCERGAPVNDVLSPVTIDEVQELIADARQSSDPLWFQGSGTVPAPDGHTVVISGALKGVVDYKPDDLTIVVRAGTTLGELDAVLSEHGHSAILPETAPDRTVGGVVASGTSGYRRLRYGPTRDRVIGVTIVTGYGEIVRGGGQLVKNVTGYDMPRLMTGSNGALGFIAEISAARRRCLRTFLGASDSRRARRCRRRAILNQRQKEDRIMTNTMKTDGLALLTTKQAAERLSIGPRKLWTLTNCGEIPHVRIDKCVRYRPGDLAAYVEAHTQTGRGRR